jgi:hypothetical protein
MNTQKNDEPKFDYPWEDSTIITFRDLQWQIHLEKNPNGRIPPPLLKFDGRAETKAADAVTSTDDSRFFLFEFKRVKADISTETKKPMWKMFRKITEFEKHNVFLEISRKCHHFAFTDILPKNDEFPKSKGKIDETENREVSMESSIYFDTVMESYINDCEKSIVNEQSKINSLKLGATRISKDALLKDDILNFNFWKNKLLSFLNFDDYTAFQQRKLKELILDENNGVTFVQMSSYLNALSTIIDGGNGAPLKFIVLSNDGFIWPIATLAEFQKLSKIFEVAFQKNEKKKLDDLNKELLETKNYLLSDRDIKKTKILRAFSNIANNVGKPLTNGASINGKAAALPAPLGKKTPGI